MADAVAAELEALYHENYGKGARRVSAEFVGDDALVCFLEQLEFQPHEEYVIDSGRGAELVWIRHEFQKAIETTLRAVAERATGRQVSVCNSITNIDPPVAIEIFMFEPKA